MNPDYQSSYSKPETPYDQKFWDNYALFLLKHGISKKYITWYVLRTKQYIAAFPSTSVREHSPKHIEGYVISKANDNQLKDWQFTQIVAIATQKQALEEVRHGSPKPSRSNLIR